MTDDKFEFTDELPPAYEKAGKSKYDNFVAALKAHPGQWAQLPYTGVNHYGVASTIRTGGGLKRSVAAYQAFTPRESFEVAVRTQVNARAVWVRYVTEDQYMKIPDAQLITTIVNLDEERSYGEREPADIDAEAKPYESEALRRYGKDAMENLANYCVEYRATAEDIRTSIERAGNADAVVAIMKGEQ